MANFRPLQPAPMDKETSPQPQPKPLLTSKPKRTVTLGACVACRKRKSKCDGNRPSCTCCAQKDTECIYELGPNEKPSQAMKRKNEEMQGELSNLRQLYDYLRLRPEHEAIDILRRIRSSSPDMAPSQRIQELADFVRRGDLRGQQQPTESSPNSYQEANQHMTLPPLRVALDSPTSMNSYSLPFPGILSMGADGPNAQRRRLTNDTDVSARLDSLIPPPPTSIEAILHASSSAAIDNLAADPRLAAAKNWTRVTSDTHFLANLLSSWTEREHIFYHYLDRDAFLDDMASGRTDYCSELLVNALLASACFHSPLVKDRNKPLAEGSMITFFYKEARRLWALEEGHLSLTRLQSSILLYLVLAKLGRDRDGHAFLLEACDMSHKLGLFQPQSQSPPSGQRPLGTTRGRWKHVRAVTAWGLFNFQLAMAFTYSLPAVIKTLPPMPIPYEHSPDAKALFRSQCAMHTILLDWVGVVQNFDDNGTQLQPSIDQIEECYQRLFSWWNSKHPSLEPYKYPSQANILFAMIYNVNVLNLFQPFLDRKSASDETEHYCERAGTIFSASLEELRRLITLHETHHGWANAITLVIHVITVASFGTLDELAPYRLDSIPPEKNEAYQGLLTCLRALSVLLSYSYYAQPLFRLLTQKCQKSGMQLPVEVQGVLDYCMSEEWTKKAASLVSSQYIAETRRVATNVETSRMDAIISEWESLKVDDNQSS